MDFLDVKGISPSGIYYKFSPSELNDLIQSFVFVHSGFNLNLSVGCYENAVETYLLWNDNEKLVDEFNYFESNKSDDYIKLNLSTDDDSEFDNLYNVLCVLFDNEEVSAEYDKNTDSFYLFALIE